MDKFGLPAIEALLGASSLGAAMFALIAVVFSTYVRKRAASTYDRDHAILSVLRSSYEDRIADLNNRLLATESRWKEVNHLLLDSQRAQPTSIEDARVPITSFLRQFGITASDAEVDPALIFVLTPFNERERPVFNVIQTVCSRYGFRCMRGDEEFAGEILPHVVALITKARLVVANISGRNPNVYYELGIAHALGKPTILVSRTLDEVPFDLRTKRIVLFGDRKDLAEKLRDEMVKLLSEAGTSAGQRSEAQPDGSKS